MTTSHITFELDKYLEENKIKIFFDKFLTEFPNFKKLRNLNGCVQITGAPLCYAKYGSSVVKDWFAGNQVIYQPNLPFTSFRMTSKEVAEMKENVRLRGWGFGNIANFCREVLEPRWKLEYKQIKKILHGLIILKNRFSSEDEEDSIFKFDYYV